jgi:holo-[acyl-carrier protein] synthase
VYGVIVVGHGIDIVEVEHFRRMCQAHSDEVLSRTFTPAELAQGREAPDCAERLAGRFAAKEAVLKALGLGWTHEIAWTDIEIAALPSGAPTVIVGGRCGELAVEHGVTSWLVSISHTAAVAVGSVIALAEEGTVAASREPPLPIKESDT